MLALLQEVLEAVLAVVDLVEQEALGLVGERVVAQEVAEVLEVADMLVHLDQLEVVVAAAVLEPILMEILQLPMLSTIRGLYIKRVDSTRAG